MNTLSEEEQTTVAAPHRRALWRCPLYVQIMAAATLGVVIGLWLPPSMAGPLDTPARLILRLLGAIAPPLILVAVMRALLATKVHGKTAGRMFFLLASNTMVAILIG